MDMSWRGLRRRLLRRGATGEGHLEADLCWSVACMGRGGASSIGRFGIATGVADVSGGGAEMSWWRDCLLNVLVVMIGRVSIWLWQGRWHFSFFLDK